MGDNDRAHVCDVTVERQKVKGTKHHLEKESYCYSEEKRTTLPILVKFLDQSCCQICRSCSKVSWTHCSQCCQNGP